MVAEFQDALQALVSRDALLAADPPIIRQRLLVALRRERADQSYGSTTRRLVQQFQQEKRLEVTGAVDERTAFALNILLGELGLLAEEPRPEHPVFEVWGRVSLSDDSPAVGLKVVAADRDLRHEQVLGKAQTDRDGFYRILYSEQLFHRAEKGHADLVVRVLGPDGDVLAATEILFNAPESACVDIVIAEDVLPPPSEFERLGNELMPLLDGVPPAELTTDDLAFLTQETGLDAKHIDFFASSYRLAQKTLLPPAFFYGLARQGYPTDLAPLLALSRSILLSAIKAAIEDNQVPLAIEPDLGNIFQRWQTLS